MAMLTPEEKEEIDLLNSKIARRKLEIERDDWKHAFETLADFVRRNFSEMTLFEVTEKVKELRPKKVK